MKHSKHRIMKTEDVLALHDALVNTLRSRYPGINAHEMYDHLIVAAAALGADLARHEPNPGKTAEQHGAALISNTKNFLGMLP